MVLFEVVSFLFFVKLHLIEETMLFEGDEFCF